jgi:hypothetical protein
MDFLRWNYILNNIFLSIIYKMKKAVLIGCNYPNTPYQLYGCINDVMTMNNILKRCFGYNDNEIIMLTDALPKSSNLYPSKNNIMNVLRNVFLSTNEKIYVHYSGHGSNVIDKNKDELDVYDECIIPTDYNGTNMIIDDDLYALFTHVRPSCQVFLSFDSCMSGTICDLNYCFNYNTSTNKFNTINTNKKNIYEIKNIISFSAVQDNQYALDVYANGKAQGAFTMAINNVINKYGNLISLTIFFTCVYNELKSNGYTSMTPLISASKNINLNNMNFAFASAPIIIPINNNKKVLLKK